MDFLAMDNTVRFRHLYRDFQYGQHRKFPIRYDPLLATTSDLSNLT